MKPLKKFRHQYHLRHSEQGLLAWDVSRLISLSREFPVMEVALADIQELDEPFWYSTGGATPTCRSIAEHALLINNTDLSYPIILCDEGRVMDGMHRVCKAYMQGLQHIKAVQFTSYLEPDYVGVDVAELPYPAKC